MKNLMFAFLTVFMLSFSTSLKAQQPNNSFFNLEQLFNLDLNELMKELDEEMSSTKEIWSRYLDSSMIDSTILQLKGFSNNGTFDSLFNQLPKAFEEFNLGNMSDMIQQFMKEFDLGQGFDALPFLNPMQPKLDSLNIEEWKIVPDVPKEQKPKVDPKDVKQI